MFKSISLVLTLICLLSAPSMGHLSHGKTHVTCNHCGGSGHCESDWPCGSGKDSAGNPEYMCGGSGKCFYCGGKGSI